MVGVVQPTRLLDWVFSRAFKVAQPAFGVLILEGGASLGVGIGLLISRSRYARANLRLVARRHGSSSVSLFVRHDRPRLSKERHFQTKS